MVQMSDHSSDFCTFSDFWYGCVSVHGVSCVLSPPPKNRVPVLPGSCEKLTDERAGISHFLLMACGLAPRQRARRAGRWTCRSTSGATSTVGLLARVTGTRAASDESDARAQASKGERGGMWEPVRTVLLLPCRQYNHQARKLPGWEGRFAGRGAV